MSPLHAEVTTTDQSAVGGTDYVALTAQTVTFATNDAEEDVVLTITDDSDVEGNEQLLVTVAFGTAVTGHVLDELYQTTVVIGDEDSPSKLL